MKIRREPRACRYCKVVLPRRKGYKTKYCSDRCRMKAWHRGHKARVEAAKRIVFHAIETGEVHPDLKNALSVVIPDRGKNAEKNKTRDMSKLWRDKAHEDTLGHFLLGSMSSSGIPGPCLKPGLGHCWESIKGFSYWRCECGAEVTGIYP